MWSIFLKNWNGRSFFLEDQLTSALIFLSIPMLQVLMAMELTTRVSGLGGIGFRANHWGLIRVPQLLIKSYFLLF